MSVQVDVHMDITGFPVLVGRSYMTHRRSQTSTVFEYDSHYQADGFASLTPSMPVDQKRHFFEGLPGIFQDASPDRWGRNLIKRRLRSQQTLRTAREISDVDFLLGVSDQSRQGALRFTRRDSEVFESFTGSVPPLIRLPRLLNAAQSVARGDDSYEAFKELLDAGSGSLGGARPKASVSDGERLLVAKFPHPGDAWDVMAWEKTALDLAQSSGIDAPRRQLVNVDGRAVLLLDRFDREGSRRLHYASAMTMLEGDDGDTFDYADLGESMIDFAPNLRASHEALVRRVALSIVIHNTDDHMRNHGFLHGSTGWAASPVFDINPDPDPKASRVTGVYGETHLPQEAEALAALASDLGVSRQRTTDIVSDVLQATSRWEETAGSNGVKRSEVEDFREVFESGRSVLESRFDVGRAPPPSSGAGLKVQRRKKHTGEPGNKGEFGSRKKEPPGNVGL